MASPSFSICKKNWPLLPGALFFSDRVTRNHPRENIRKLENIKLVLSICNKHQTHLAGLSCTTKLQDQFSCTCSWRRDVLVLHRVTCLHKSTSIFLFSYIFFYPVISSFNMFPSRCKFYNPDQTCYEIWCSIFMFVGKKKTTELQLSFTLSLWAFCRVYISLWRAWRLVSL